MRLHIPFSKTDQLHHGDEVVIARTGAVTYPVAMLEYYMKCMRMCWEDIRPLFCPIQRTKRGAVLRESGKVSYSCLRDLFRKKLVAMGFNLDKYGLQVFGQEEPLQQPMQRFLTGSLSDMADGDRRMPRTGMWRMPCRKGWKFPSD